MRGSLGFELTVALAKALGLEGFPVEAITLETDCRGYPTVHVRLTPTGEQVVAITNAIVSCPYPLQPVSTLSGDSSDES